MTRRRSPVRVRPGHRHAVAGPAPDIDRVVLQLNRIFVRRGLSTALAIGGYLLENLFAGDMRAYRDRDYGWTLFAELLQRNDLAMSRSYLTLSLQVLEQVAQLPEAIAQALCYSHHIELLAVKDVEAKRIIASRSLENGWSRPQLQRQVWEHLGHGRRGRKTTASPPARALRELDRRSRDLERATRTDSWDGDERDEPDRLAARLDRLVARMREIEARMGERQEG